jgi:hypothetical protein
MEPTKDANPPKKEVVAEVGRRINAIYANGYRRCTDEEFKANMEKFEEIWNGPIAKSRGKITGSPLFDSVYIDPPDAARPPADNATKRRASGFHTDDSTFVLGADSVTPSSSRIEVVQENKRSPSGGNTVCPEPSASGRATLTIKINDLQLIFDIDDSTIRKSDLDSTNTDADGSAIDDDIAGNTRMSAQFEAWKARQRVEKDLVDPPIGKSVFIATVLQCIY